jgi:hypothetical protein
MSLMAYDLTVVRDNGAPVVKFPAAPSSYGSFSPGHVFIFNRQQFLISKVGHEMVGNADFTTCRTLLVVGPQRAEDHPVPWPW